MVRCPGMEPHLETWGLAGAKELWLRTSPELALKGLLAAGVERFFEVARVFRADEAGPWHRGEFDLLEWYRAYEELEVIAEDCEALLSWVAASLGRDPSAIVPGVDLRSPFERTTVREAVEKRTGDGVHLVSGCDEKHIGEIKGNIEIMISKTIVLFRIKDLEKCRGRISLK